MGTIHSELLVVGAGSGGFAAALSAARAGIEVYLVEISSHLGGNANRCGVNNWESVVGATGYPFEIYRALKARSAVGIYSYGRHCLWNGYDVIPGGEHRIDDNYRYVDTLRRHGLRSLREDEDFARRVLHGVSFEPDAYEQVLYELLEETRNCEILYNTGITEVETDAGRVVAVGLPDGRKIEANYYVDGTGDGDLCAAAGCEVMIGQESANRFGEPSASPEPNDRINGVTLMYRVTRAANPSTEEIPDDVPNACWWRDAFPAAAFFEFPSGDWSVNMLPTMEGREYLEMESEAAYEECRRRVLAHWHSVQTNYPEYRELRIRSMSEAVGVRESRRIVGEHVLTEIDVVTEFREGYHEDTIAIADHALDRHGDKGGAHEVDDPFSIPYRCLIPKGFTNLLIACRAASFSSIAASSCRLSRTMMQLGQAAGNAVAIASESGSPLPTVSATRLRNRLVEQNVQLDFPLDPDLESYLRSE